MQNGLQNSVMTPARWEQVKTVVQTALECEPRERAEYLAAACADDVALRTEVESLIAYQSDSSGFIESPAFALATGEFLTDAQSQPDERTGQLIGPYRVVRELGRGGMGAVYLAKRADDEYRKQVAIKLIKRGMDSAFVLRRFRNERQILAALNHPNIARLHDGGTTADGLPYLVMEYVEGTLLDEYCAQRQLTITERLQLFRQICAAVHYAHQHLVIHRDLKPSNILVTEEGTPKLLDFGIAKLLTPELAAATLDQTQGGLRLMTPAYASPEQVRGEPITTASDVYALGVVLYELLTGRSPYQLREHTQQAILQAVCEQEPERLSTRAKTQDGSRKSAEAQTSSSRLPSAFRLPPSRLRGDLDNIVLMALRKEPQRRYASVEQFSEDLRRHLAGLPVIARQDTLGYRTNKFVRRNRLALSAAALVLLTLSGGIVTTQRARTRAERRFNEVRQLAHTVLFDYHDAIAALPGSTAVRERLIKDTQRYLDNLAGEAAEDRELQREIASAYVKIGDVQGGVSTSGGNTLSSSSLGDTQGAFESYSKAMAINERLILFAPDDQELAEDLAKSYSRMAEINASMGNLQATANYYRRGMATFEKLLAADSLNKSARFKLSGFYYNLGNALGVPGSPNLGRPQEALKYLGKAGEFDESLLAEEPNNLNYRQAVGTKYGNIGRIHYGGGNYSEALIYYRKALENGEQLVRADATNALYRRELAVQYRNVGNALLATGDQTGAIENLRRAMAVFENLMAADASDARIRRSAAYGYRDLGVALSAAEQPDEALKNLNLALNIFAELSARDAKNAVVKQQIALTRLKLSEFFMKSGEAAKAAENARQSIAVSEALIAGGIQDVDAPKTLAAARVQLDKCLSLAAKK